MIEPLLVKELHLLEECDPTAELCSNNQDQLNKEQLNELQANQEQANQQQLNEYAALSRLFLNLRGKGVSLSGEDLARLCHWRKALIPARVVEEVMTDLDDELSAAGKAFPTTLLVVERRLKKRLAELGYGLA